MMKDKKKIPLIYAYLYMKIKKKMRGNMIKGTVLRKIIQREILYSKKSGEKESFKGGNTKGIPRRYCYDIIKDLVDLELLERIDRVKYEDKKVFEVIERLKDWDIEGKLKKDSLIRKKLGPAINLLKEDPVYMVTKSKCDKMLREAFW